MRLSLLVVSHCIGKLVPLAPPHCYPAALRCTGWGAVPGVAKAALREGPSAGEASFKKEKQKLPRG